MKLLIIDSHCLCHMAKHAMKSFEYEQQQVGVVFGFLLQLQKLAKTWYPCRFAFAWDSPQSKRREIFPEYKPRNHKERTPEEKELDEISYPQFDTVREKILPAIGFKNIFRFEGFEGDDIIASMVKNNHSMFPRNVIVSADEDLFQLLSCNVEIYSPYTKNIFSYSDFREKWFIKPEQWADVKAIAGCHSDGVPGIPRVGEETAAKYLRNELKVHTKTFSAILKGKSVIERNKRLVTLPFEDTPAAYIVEEELSLTGFINVCQKYGFRSFVTKEGLSTWRSILPLK